MKQLDELVAIAKASDVTLEASLVALRAANKAITALAAVTASIQREAHEAEFEEIPEVLRSHLEGRLLQRTRYVADATVQITNRLRDLARGVRDLKGDCTEVEGLATPVASPTSAP